MTFLPSNTNRGISFGSQSVPPDGSTDAKICLIGEAPGNYEIRAGKPFVGPAGRVLEQCLHGAGLIRGELYITNFIKHKISSISKYYNERTKQLTDLGHKHQAELIEELSSVDANVFIPLGNPATCALLNQGGIMDLRGYMFAGDTVGGRKVIPTIHPSAALRGQYIYRHFITADLRKAKSESETRDIVWPDIDIHIPDSYEEVIATLDMLSKEKAISIDIEVINHEVSCIGFCPEPNVGYVIPLYHQPIKWSEQQEVNIWEAIANIMENPDITKIGQNFIFDMQFLAIRNNIITRGYVEDTMIMHSLVLPDFPKSLGFLVSLHTNRPMWKDMVKWKGSDIIKKDN